MYEIFEKLCCENGVTPYKVSKATGISRTTFSEWKQGKYELKQDKLKRLAEYFNVSVEYIRTGKDTPKESAEGTTYYFNDETARKAQELYDDPNLRILFDAARDSKPEDLQMAADLLKRLKETNPDA